MPLLADDSGEEVSPPVPPLASEEAATADVSLTETELLNSVADKVLDGGGAAAAAAAQPTPVATDWKSLTVAKLKDELRSRGLKVGGKKKELVRRLAEDDASRAAAAAAHLVEGAADSASAAAAAPANLSTFDEVWEQQQEKAAAESAAESAAEAGSVAGSVAGTAAAANDDETATSEISGTAGSIATGKVSPLLARDGDDSDDDDGEDEESANSLGPPAPPPRSRDASKDDDDEEQVDESASAYTAATTGVAAVAAAVAVGTTAADTSAAAGVSSEEMSQRDATTEIADGADGFEDIEEGRAGVSMANQTCTSESAYGAAYGDDADADFVDEDEEENKPPQSKEEAVAKNGTTGGGRCGGKQTKVVLAVLGVIVAAAIAIGACIGAGVINFGDGSSSSNPKQAGSDGFGDLTAEPTVETDRPTVKPGTPTVSPTARPTASPTLSPVAATRYEAGADFDVAAALSGPDAVATEGTAQREALKWLVDADPLRLTTDAAAAAARPGLTLVDSDKFLQRYALTAVIFSLTDGGEQESGGSEMGLDINDEEVVAVVEEEEEVEDVEVMVDDKEAEKAAKEAEKAAKQKWQAPAPADGGRQRRIMAAELLPAGIDECDLKFIGCNQEGKITKINFRKMGLGGILSPEISQFWQTLTVLDLSDNQIEGTIPDSIYDMYWLEALYLKSNRFTGTISPKIGQLTSLVNFYAGQNILKGGVPLGFGQCKNLRNLSLYKNNLSGPIPDWSTLNGLHYLDLGFNKMTGTLPESLVKHRILRLLYLNNNQVSTSVDGMNEWDILFKCIYRLTPFDLSLCSDPYCL